MSINFSHTLWSPSDTVKDVAETLGISNLPDDVAKTLAMDVEYRIHEVIEQALKFMRHSKRTTLGTSDVGEALRALNVEPLYGYEGVANEKSVSYREAITGPGQTLYYVDDDEVDFERLINQPLPKVPRATSLTAHWVAIDGVQPAIPQNPLASDIRAMSVDLRGAQTTNNSIATINGSSDVKVKPLVKHVLSQELQLYFDRVVGALMDGSEVVMTATGDEKEAAVKQHAAALSSLRNDPGFHQLVPYFVQFVAEKVTHNLKNLPILYTMLQVIDALLTNPTLFMDPYIHSIMPSVLTLILAKKIGPKPGHEDIVEDSQVTISQYSIRDFAASLLARICDKYNEIYASLKPRAIRTLLKAFMDPTKPIPTLYGALQGIQALGNEAVRVVIVGNLKLWSDTLYNRLLKSSSDSTLELEQLNKCLISALRQIKGQAIYPDQELTEQEIERCKEMVGEKVYELIEKLNDVQQIVHGLVDFEGRQVE